MKVQIHELVLREVEITLPIYRMSEGWSDTGRHPKYVRIDELPNERLRRTTVSYCTGMPQSWEVTMDIYAIIEEQDVIDSYEWQAGTAEEFQRHLSLACVFIEGLR